MTKTVGAAAHEIAEQATLGFQKALDDTRRDRASGKMRNGDGALLVAATTASRTGSRILWTLGIGFVALALGLAATLAWAIRKHRRRRSELVQSDGALLLLTEALKSSATQPGGEELRSLLKTSMRDPAGGKLIRKAFGAQGLHELGLDAPA
jgi:Flp pilus assembly protein TadB